MGQGEGNAGGGFVAEVIVLSLGRYNEMGGNGGRSEFMAAARELRLE
jgi:hypothetical protein